MSGHGELRHHFNLHLIKKSLICDYIKSMGQKIIKKSAQEPTENSQP